VATPSGLSPGGAGGILLIEGGNIMKKFLSSRRSVLRIKALDNWSFAHSIIVSGQRSAVSGIIPV
jgi:hypothetical protein